MLSTPSNRRFVAIALVFLVIALAGCTNTVVRVTGYGPDAYRFWMDGCTVTKVVVNGKTQTKTLASKTDCDCIYNDIADKTKDDKPNNPRYPITWDDFTAYNSKVQNASNGEVPAPPANLTKAVNHCPRGAGPAVPATTTTTAKPA